MVKNLLSLLSTRQTTILSGATVLMVMVAASKLLGLIRDRLLAHHFSPDEVAVFLAAFRLPDLLFQILIFGGVSAAFIPVFTEIMEKKGEGEAFKFASNILNVVLLGFTLVGILALIFARPLTNLIVPGFPDEQKIATATLTQVIILGQILLVVGSFFAGVCQSYQRFIIPALAAIVYNIGIITGVIFLSPYLGLYGPALGVVLGAAFHILVQMPLITTLGFRHQLNLDVFNEGIKEVLGLMSIRTLGVIAEQVNETVGVILASLISTSSVTYLVFAQHLQAVPVGLFGATIAQAALPILSLEKAKGEMESFKKTLLTTMHQILFLTLPAAAILTVLKIPSVRLVFGAYRFDWQSTVLTSQALAFMAMGLAAQSVVMLLVRGFYALKDTRTPVIISVSSVALNIILSALFVTVFHWEIWSLGLSFTITAFLSALFLTLTLEKKLGGFAFEDLYLPIIKMMVSALIAAVALYIPVKFLDQLVFDTTRTFNLLLLTGIASLFGLSVYLSLVWAFKVRELETFGKLFRRLANLQLSVKTKEMVEETGAV